MVKKGMSHSPSSKRKWAVKYAPTGKLVEKFLTKKEANEVLDFRNTLCYALKVKPQYKIIDISF